MVKGEELTNGLCLLLAALVQSAKQFWSLKYGSNLEYIRLMLGHSDISIASRAYLHVADADLSEASKQTSTVVNLGFGRSKKGCLSLPPNRIPLEAR